MQRGSDIAPQRVKPVLLKARLGRAQSDNNGENMTFWLCFFFFAPATAASAC